MITSRVIPSSWHSCEKYASPRSLMRLYDVIHRRDQRDALARDRPLLGARLREHRDECALELLRVDVVALHDLAGRVARFAVEERTRLALVLAKLLAELAVLRVGDQAAAQPLLDLFGRLALLVDELLRNRRQERLRFQEEQRRGDHEILGGDLDVARLHRAHVREILLGDARQRHGRDVELLLFDQIQQKVERPVEGVEADAKRVASAVVCASVVRRTTGSAVRATIGGLAERAGMLGKKLEREVDQALLVDVFERLARLRQIEPARVVYLVIVIGRIARKVAHQEERDRLAVLGLADVKPVRDLVEACDDLAPAAGLLANFAQRRLLGRLARLDVSFGSVQTRGGSPRPISSAS